MTDEFKVFKLKGLSIDGLSHLNDILLDLVHVRPGRFFNFIADKLI